MTLAREVVLPRSVAYWRVEIVFTSWVEFEVILWRQEVWSKVRGEG